jgi:hypothetical protein
MGSPARITCDACGKRIRPGHHELRLSDPRTDQEIGLYHAGPPGSPHAICMARANRFCLPGEVLTGTVRHPDRCGPEGEYCTSAVKVS